MVEKPLTENHSGFPSPLTKLMPYVLMSIQLEAPLDQLLVLPDWLTLSATLWVISVIKCHITLQVNSYLLSIHCFRGKNVSLSNDDKPVHHGLMMLIFSWMVSTSVGLDWHQLSLFCLLNWFEYTIRRFLIKSIHGGKIITQAAHTEPPTDLQAYLAPCLCSHMQENHSVHVERSFLTLISRHCCIAAFMVDSQEAEEPTVRLDPVFACQQLASRCST